MTQYEKLTDTAKRYNITYQTAWNYYKAGRFPGSRKIGNSIFVPIEDNEENPGRDINSCATYARVSSSQNVSNLDSQSKRLQEYCAAKGYTIVKQVKEVGSGLNEDRKKLNKLFDDDSWSVLVVEHKDRLARFGFHYLSMLASSQGRRIEVINVAEQGSEEDIVNDLVSIITSFCARIYGKRRAQRKTETIIKELHDD